MDHVILAIYDFLRRHTALAWSVFILITAGLAASLLTLSYKEDISDFLPLDSDSHEAMAVYQDISGANRIYAIVSATDSIADRGRLAEGVGRLADCIGQYDTAGYVASVTATIDMESLEAVANEVYDNIPLYLTEADYGRIDSLLSSPGYIDRRMADNRQMLLFPTSSMLAANMARDPLNLFGTVAERLKAGGMPTDFDTYDGYMISPDGSRAIAIIESAFGAQESENNSRLAEMLGQAAHTAETDVGGIDIHFIGGPVIAVANAERIKRDSVLAVSIAGVLIMALLIYVFRNLLNILLIIVSVGWGWLFAMGIIAMLYDSVSIIVIGIASVILGIAINYPLHLIDHLRESEHPRAALRQIVSPLVIGNVTTVGAFLCLVPLDSPALHDLGLFSSLLLVGTIFFVLVFLPHAVRTRRRGGAQTHDPALITRLSSIPVEKSRWLVWSVAALTIVFGYFSLRTGFDSDMRNINYMTPAQRADLDYFQTLFNSNSDTADVYVVSSGGTWEEAIANNAEADSLIDSIVAAGDAHRANAVSDFIIPGHIQQQRLDRWKRFCDEHGSRITDGLAKAAGKYGFNEDAFDSFVETMRRDYESVPFDRNNLLSSTAFAANFSENSVTGVKSMVQTLKVSAASVESVEQRLNDAPGFGGMAFDVRTLNSTIASTLSDDFNYIGIACGLIVFLFLWFSLGSIELAAVSFLPMAVSWIWILGIMGMLGIRFNIVNVILATFIFGQGDDYTIFMTEGLSYEYAYRRKLLASYKNSIIVSALIMFIGIGTLVFAQHPAMRSLGQVTVVGMLSVVLMAWLLPPLVFGWLVRRDGKVRSVPLTLPGILVRVLLAAVTGVQYIALLIWRVALRLRAVSSKESAIRIRRLAASMARFDIRHIPGIHMSAAMRHTPAAAGLTAICRDHGVVSLAAILLSGCDTAVIVDSRKPVNRIARQLMRWCGIAPGDIPGDIGSHKPLLPLYIFTTVQPEGNGINVICDGHTYIEAGEPVGAGTLPAHIDKGTEDLRRRMSSPHIYRKAVYGRYMYKGAGTTRSASRTLRGICNNPERLAGISDRHDILVYDHAQGEATLLTALLYPHSRVYVIADDTDTRELIRGCADGFTPNIVISPAGEAARTQAGNVRILIAETGGNITHGLTSEQE